MIDVVADRLVRFELVPGANGHVQITANGNNTHVELQLQRRPGVGAWTEVASTSFRFEAAGQGVVAVPCGAISLVDQTGPEQGSHEYRLVATWLGPPPSGHSMNVYSCGVMISDAGPRAPE